MSCKIGFLRERSEPLLLKIELQNLQELDFCERSEQRLWKIEVENLSKLGVFFVNCERSELCLQTNNFEAPPSVQNENQIDKK